MQSRPMVVDIMSAFRQGLSIVAPSSRRPLEEHCVTSNQCSTPSAPEESGVTIHTQYFATLPALVSAILCTACEKLTGTIYALCRLFCSP